MDRLRNESDLEVAFEPDLWNDPDALAQAVADADAIIVRNQTQVTAELIAAACARGVFECVPHIPDGLAYRFQAEMFANGTVMAKAPETTSPLDILRQWMQPPA